MKSFKKKMVQSALSAAALTIVLAGCSNSNSSGTAGQSASPAGTGAPAASPTPQALPPVELIWYYGVAQQQPAQQEVEDAVNKYLKEKTKLGATVKLKPIDFGSYDQKMNVSISAGEPMDIVFTTENWLLKYNDNVKKGAFLAIDDLLPKDAPKILNEMMPKPFWEDVKADTDGKIYAVPNYQTATSAFGYVFQKRYVDKYHFDITTVKKPEDLEPFLETIKKNEPDVIPFAFSEGTNNYVDPNLRDYASFVSYDKRDPFKSFERRETPQYKSYLDLIHSWYQKGYVYQDLATVKDFTALQAKGNIAVMTDTTFKPGGEAGFATRNGGNEVVRQRISDPLFVGVTTSMNAISKTSKNPDRALMFLELVNTDKELYRLLAYGIKGKHYDDSDGTYKPIANAGYAPNSDYVFGNQFNGLVRPGQPADVFEQTKKLNEQAEIPPMFGFHFNDSSLKTETAALEAVRKEYAVPLETGTADPNVTLPKYLDALKKAGIDKVKAEVNKQLAEWAATNGKK